MAIKVSQIDQVLARDPQATIAIYSSNHLDYEGAERWGVGVSKEMGHLSIVAHKGKRIPAAEIKPHIGGGNVVDLEALRWLSGMPGPRIWVCDGVVTGVRDTFSSATTEGCKKIVDRARIRQVWSLADYLWEPDNDE
jgi:hypothetical protein